MPLSTHFRIGDTHYTSNAGNRELREFFGPIEKLYGVHYDPLTEIVITVGGSEALYLSATALLDPGDEVIILTPCFVASRAEEFLAGAYRSRFPAGMENDFDVDPDDVRAAVTPHRGHPDRLPNNPTGAVASRERRWNGRIAEENDLVVMSMKFMIAWFTVFACCFPALPGMRQRSVLLGGFKDYAMTGWWMGLPRPQPTCYRVCSVSIDHRHLLLHHRCKRRRARPLSVVSRMSIRW